MKRKLERYQEHLGKAEQDALWKHLRQLPAQTESHHRITGRRWTLSFGTAVGAIAVVAVAATLFIRLAHEETNGLTVEILEFGGERIQTSLSYSGSFYRNLNEALTVEITAADPPESVIGVNRARSADQEPPIQGLLCCRQLWSPLIIETLSAIFFGLHIAFKLFRYILCEVY